MTLYLLKRHLSPGLPTITDSNFSARATTYLKVGSKQPQCKFPGVPVFFTEIPKDSRFFSRGPEILYPHNIGYEI